MALSSMAWEGADGKKDEKGLRSEWIGEEELRAAEIICEWSRSSYKSSQIVGAIYTISSSQDSTIAEEEDEKLPFKKRKRFRECNYELDEYEEDEDEDEDEEEQKEVATSKNSIDGTIVRDGRTKASASICTNETKASMSIAKPGEISEYNEISKKVSWLSAELKRLSIRRADPFMLGTDKESIEAEVTHTAFNQQCYDVPSPGEEHFQMELELYESGNPNHTVGGEKDSITRKRSEGRRRRRENLNFVTSFLSSGKGRKANDDLYTNVKKKRSGVALEDWSRCTRMNGKGWRCSQAARPGYNLCDHHLGKMRCTTSAQKLSRNGNGEAGLRFKRKLKKQKKVEVHGLLEKTNKL